MKRAKRKIFKIIALCLLSALFLCITAAAAFVYFYPKDKVLALIVAKAEKSLKKKVVIKGIDYSFRGVKLKEVTISEKKTESQEESAIAGVAEIRLGFSLLSLLKKKLSINFVYLSNPAVVVAFDEKGVSNIEKIILQSNEDSDSPLQVQISRVTFEKASLAVKNPPPPLQLLAGAYTVDGTVLIDDNNNIEITGCTLVLPEDRGILNPEIVISKKNGDFEITGSLILDRLSLVWVAQLGNTSLPYTTASGSIDNFKITPQSAEGFLKLTTSLKNSATPAFANGYCKVNIPGNTVFLSNVGVRLQTSSFLIRSLLFSTLGKIFDFTIDSIDADLSDLRLILDSIPDKLFGKLHGNLSFTNGTYNGSLKIIEAGYDVKNKTAHGLNTELIIKDSGFIKENIPLKIHGNDVSLSVASTGRSLDRIFINLYGKAFRMKQEDSATGSPEVRAPAAFSSPVMLSGTITFDECAINDIQLQNLFVSYDFSGNRLMAGKMSAQYVGGTVDGTMAVITNVPPEVQAHIRFNGIKIQDIALITKQYNTKFFGIAEGKADLNFLLEKDILRAMNGSMEFTVSRGKMVDTGLQNGLGVLLSELKYKLKILEFDQMYGNVTMAGNSITVNSFIFNSPNLRLNMKGTLNDRVNAKPLMITLEFNNHFISELPGPTVAYLLKYLSGIWYSIPISCNGDITESKSFKLLR